MRESILKINVDVTTHSFAIANILEWQHQHKGRYTCVANVHMCMEAFDDAGFRDVVNSADLVVPDGRPLVWAQHLLGHRDAQQVRGMDLMLALCQQSAERMTPVGLYGATAELLGKLSETLTRQYPGLNIACSIAPPFRALSADEDAEIVRQINESGVRFLFVGLGCPKQERWMAEHKEKLHCIMLGVGAAFDFIAGNKPHAPRWMQSLGLEWLFRLGCEPQRLWRRYLIQNPRFVWHFFWQWVGKR